MALRLCEDTTVAKYKYGRWIWDASKEKFRFISKETGSPDWAMPAPKMIFRVKFRDQIEELIFRHRFARPKYSHDSDVITIQDIKDLAFFLAPSKALTKSFVDFMHKQTMDIFLNALIIYFEYFLKLVEFILIQRDEAIGDYGTLKNLESIKIETMISDHLSQHRLLLAREYCKVILGTGDMVKYHHLANKVKKSKTIHDRTMHEIFISFCTQIVWISMHRKAYCTIDCEINRLFRSGHFNAAEKQLSNVIEFTKREQQILYGRNDRRENYRTQKSPLIEEIVNVNHKNSDVLWIGEHKYRGTDSRLYQLEMEYVVPESQLSFIDVSHGILGHPKQIYNTMLELDWHAVRKIKYSKYYDPFRIFRQPYLEIPKWEEYIKKHKHVDSNFKFINLKFEVNIVNRQRKLWKNRDKIIESMSFLKIDDFNIVKKCQREIENLGKTIHIDRNKIIDEFLLARTRLHKYKSKERN